VNYRHAFHAGNFADVFKHALLARILIYLARKPAPFRFIDSHAGAGAYDLAGAEASRSGEWRLGVARLKDAEPPPDVAALLAPYLDALGPLDAIGRPARYPGSPALAKALLRRQDRLSLCELRDEERAALVAAMGRDSRLSIVGLDGYVALRAFVPPKERRGLVLIDPPYETSDEAERVAKALATALGKWPSGTFAHWRPIKDRREDANFVNGVAALGIGNMLELEINVGEAPATPDGRHPLTSCGLLVVNPPFVLAEEARALLPWLTKVLARGADATFAIRWLTPPQ